MHVPPPESFDLDTPTKDSNVVHDCWRLERYDGWTFTKENMKSHPEHPLTFETLLGQAWPRHHGQQ